MQTIEKSGELIFPIISLVLLGAGWVFSGVVPPECRFLKYFEIYFLWLLGENVFSALIS